LNHPWIIKAKEVPIRKGKNDMNELRKLLSGSKESNLSGKHSGKHEDPSKKKRIYACDIISSKNLSKGKHSFTTLNNTLNRTAKLEKSKPHCDDKSPSNKKLKVDTTKPKILDLLKLELRKCSEEKSKCKSHRF
jgi:hypothetical protein